MYTKQTKNAEQIVTAALAATGSTWIKKADLLSYMAARNISKEIINAAIVSIRSCISLTKTGKVSLQRHISTQWKIRLLKM